MLSSLHEAQAEAERAGKMKEVECKREVQRMAARMQEEMDQYRRGVQEERGAQLRRLLAELQSMSLSLTHAEEDQQSQSTRRDAAEAEVRRLEEELGSGGWTAPRAPG